MSPKILRNDARTEQPLITSRRCLVAAIIFFVLMVVLGAVPGKATALSAAVYDKLLHFLAYSVLSGLLYLGFTGGPATRAFRTLIAASVLGALDEAIQTLMPYRDANWMDWKFDMIATLSCVTLLLFFHLLYSRLTGGTAEAGSEMAIAARTEGTE